MTIYNNKLTLANSGSVGTCFYHPYDFVASDHCMIIWLKDKELTENIAIFLTAIFQKLKSKYAFDKEINDQRLRFEIIYLPVYKNGKIAFDFMESFMENLRQKNPQKLLSYYHQKLSNLSHTNNNNCHNID